ncbi:NGG1p interacting factor NIF3 [Ectothiorhodospiraceae bacterium BW-2]|nr:NGG1p interacting factor NIF3 [Ectothiorhodospiraceae bacterium BW-2]
MGSSILYKLVIFLPETALASVKAALFEAGAGAFGHYDCCCWESSGQSQYRPLAGSHPHSGEMGRLHVETEYRLEMVCREEVLEEAVTALWHHHPYEQPAYEVIQLHPFTLFIPPNLS